MERLYTKEVVIQVLGNILEFENNTLNLYKEYIKSLDDASTATVFKRLRDEEAKHIESIKALIEKLD